MIRMIVAIPGPQFLLIFALLSIACIYLAWMWGNKDGSDGHRMPGPHTLDPILISALSGGRNAVIRTVMFDLWNRDIIRIKGEGASAVMEALPSSEKMGTAVHEEIFKFALQGPRSPSELFSNAGLNSKIEAHIAPTISELERQHLLQTRADLSRTRQAFSTGLAVIAGVGGSKLVLGIFRHKPVGFLVVELIVSIAAISAATRPWRVKPTRLGYRYLSRLKKHFRWMEEHLSKKNHYTGIDPVFAVAIFGISPLIGSPLFDTFGRAFRAGGTNPGSGCSGGGGGGGCDGCGGCGGD